MSPIDSPPSSSKKKDKTDTTFSRGSSPAESISVNPDTTTHKVTINLPKVKPLEVQVKSIARNLAFLNTPLPPKDGLNPSAIKDRILRIHPHFEIGKDPYGQVTIIFLFDTPEERNKLIDELRTTFFASPKLEINQPFQLRDARDLILTQRESMILLYNIEAFTPRHEKFEKALADVIEIKTRD